ncbi:hypothetical protein [uncultured Brachyspira sp.]|uniref:hypothetical protein n=1 Tax=uncultured Brachyspira sp. TaxID=221953 RepID=UPI00262EE833|nr:hypothetical protein [uncultured Brachyspira sp.]
MNNNIKKESIFNVVEVIKDDNIYLYIINNLSEELKNYIRENFRLICVGDNRD